LADSHKRCFVLMPFSEALREVYTKVYQPVCRRAGIDCWRVDELARPGSITRDIVEGILDSHLIIADLTGRNPNVFYELGIAHFSGNKTVMTSQRIEDVPFDIANYRVLIYKQSLVGFRTLSRNLSRAIAELLAALDRTNNPLQEALAHRGVGRHGSNIPLARAVRFAELPTKLVEFLEAHRVVYKSDLTLHLLEQMAQVPGVGFKALSLFCTGLVHSSDYDDLPFLHQFVAKHRLDTTGTRTYWS